MFDKCFAFYIELFEILLLKFTTYVLTNSHLLFSLTEMTDLSLSTRVEFRNIFKIYYSRCTIMYCCSAAYFKYELLGS